MTSALVGGSLEVRFALLTADSVTTPWFLSNSPLGSNGECDMRTAHEGALVQSGSKKALLVWYVTHLVPFGPNRKVMTDGWGAEDVVVCESTSPLCAKRRESDRCSRLAGRRRAGGRRAAV